MNTLDSESRAGTTKLNSERKVSALPCLESSEDQHIEKAFIDLVCTIFPLRLSSFHSF